MARACPKNIVDIFFYMALAPMTLSTYVLCP